MTDPADDDLRTEIARLRAEVARLNGHRFLRDLNSRPRLLWTSFLRGLAMGLGTVAGATILVSVAAFLLAQVNWIPILGDWAQQIAEEIQPER